MYSGRLVLRRLHNRCLIARLDWGAGLNRLFSEFGFGRRSGPGLGLGRRRSGSFSRNGGMFGGSLPSRRKLLSRGNKALFLLVCLFAVLAWGFYGLEKSIEPPLTQMAEIRAKQIATETINRVIVEKIVSNVEYADLMTVHKDQEGRPVLIQPNLLKIEKLQAVALLEINRALQNLGEQQFNIPLGLVFENKLLASSGPNVKVSVVQDGTVDVEVINEFKQAGINQTRHILSLKVNAEMMTVVPLSRTKTQVSTVVKVADNIIIGQVPSVLMNWPK